MLRRIYQIEESEQQEKQNGNKRKSPFGSRYTDVSVEHTLTLSQRRNPACVSIAGSLFHIRCCRMHQARMTSLLASCCTAFWRNCMSLEKKRTPFCFCEHGASHKNRSQLTPHAKAEENQPYLFEVGHLRILIKNTLTREPDEKFHGMALL